MPSPQQSASTNLCQYQIVPDISHSPTTEQSHSAQVDSSILCPVPLGSAEPTARQIIEEHSTAENKPKSEVVLFLSKLRYARNDTQHSRICKSMSEVVLLPRKCENAEITHKLQRPGTSPPSRFVFLSILHRAFSGACWPGAMEHDQCGVVLLAFLLRIDRREGNRMHRLVSMRLLCALFDKSSVQDAAYFRMTTPLWNPRLNTSVCAR